MNQQDLFPKEKRTAVFSHDRAYRYSLDIVWDAALPAAMVIGLNPSTADEFEDDRTVAKCKKLCRRLGYGSLVMTNLFAFRATDPDVMKAHPSPVGELNDATLKEVRARCAMAIAAWGVDGPHLGREAQVLAFLTDLHCLKLTKGGHPQHPLYLPGILDPVAFAAPH